MCIDENGFVWRQLSAVCVFIVRFKQKLPKTHKLTFVGATLAVAPFPTGSVCL